MKSILFALATLISTTGFAAEKKIVRGTDRFELVYQLTVPKLTQAGTLWLPLARTDAHQKFEVLAIHSPIGWHKTRDAAGQNEVLRCRGALRALRKAFASFGHCVPFVEL